MCAETNSKRTKSRSSTSKVSNKVHPRKLKLALLVSPGSKRSVTRESMTNDNLDISKDVEVEIKESEPLNVQIGKKADWVNENMKFKDDETLDSIDFMNGDSKLTVVLKKRHNRMFKIQVYLNGTTEIKPVTYNGSHTAFTFWNLFKSMIDDNSKEEVKAIEN